MIKITSELKTSQGFKSTISVLEINSYTLTETIQLVQNPVFPIVGGVKNISVNVSVYKSQTDKNNNAQPVSYLDFPYSFQLSPGIEDVVNEEFLYQAISQRLTDYGYLNEVL